MRGGRLFKGGPLIYSQQFQQARTFLENNKTRDNKFISLQQDKQGVKSNINNIRVH